jgi:hypothetical protein
MARQMFLFERYDANQDWHALPHACRMDLLRLCARIVSREMQRTHEETDDGRNYDNQDPDSSS